MINETLEKIRQGWLKDVGYLRIANELGQNPDMVKELYDKWTEESMKEMGLSN